MTKNDIKSCIRWGIVGAVLTWPLVVAWMLLLGVEG